MSTRRSTHLYRPPPAWLPRDSGGFDATGLSHTEVRRAVTEIRGAITEWKRLLHLDDSWRSRTFYRTKFVDSRASQLDICLLVYDLLRLEASDRGLRLPAWRGDLDAAPTARRPRS